MKDTFLRKHCQVLLSATVQLYKLGRGVGECWYLLPVLGCLFRFLPVCVPSVVVVVGLVDRESPLKVYTQNIQYASRANIDVWLLNTFYKNVKDSTTKLNSTNYAKHT